MYFRRISTGLVLTAMLFSPGNSAEINPIPDLSGYWGRTLFNLEAPASGPGPIVNLARKADGTIDDNTARIGDFNNPLLKPDAAAILKQRGEFSQTGMSIPDTLNQCWVEPPPFALAIQAYFLLTQQKDEVVIAYINDHQIRHVRLNVAHPDHIVPSWTGDSVGHYEGDTLVVDTVGIKVGPFSTLDRYGTPFSESLHLVERYRLIDGKTAADAIRRHRRTFTTNDAASPFGIFGTDIDLNTDKKALQVDVTVDDPGTFTKPWSGRVTYQSGSGWTEVACAENLRDANGPERHVPVALKPDF